MITVNTYYLLNMRLNRPEVETGLATVIRILL